MNNENASGIGILSVLAAFYFAGATIILFVLWKGFKIKPQDLEKGWAKLIQLPLLPALFIWMLILACLSIPLHWLYPEKHMTMIDFEGSEEEKQKLREYRTLLSKKGLARRLAEKLGFAQKVDPPGPFAPRP